MPWNRIKKMFKKKRPQSKDQLVSFDGGEIGLKDAVPFKLEPSEEYPNGVPLHVKHIGSDAVNGNEWTVNGVNITARSIMDAQREYLKRYSK